MIMITIVISFINVTLYGIECNMTDILSSLRHFSFFRKNMI